MTDKFSDFKLTFPENLKRDANLSSTEALSFDDLGDFIEEREKIKRKIEDNLDTKLRIDYSDFSNHVFFGSATEKFGIASARVLTKYPFNGNAEEKDAFALTSSGYENHIFDEWPRDVSYAFFNGTDQYITASDYDNDLYIGSSSLYVSAWIDPVIADQMTIIQALSASVSPVKKHGFDFYLSGTTDPHLNFTLYSGSEASTVSASYSAFTSSFNNVAAIYDKETNILSLYINKNHQVSSSVSYNAIEFSPLTFFVGSGSQYTTESSSFGFYSGSIDEVRIAHTASSLWHEKNYLRPIEAESYVKLHYKFNEGTVGTGSVDSVVIDYSKSGIHGKIESYTENARVSGSVMLHDPGDPILYSFHSRVMSFTSSLITSASLYDADNNNNIFNLIPQNVMQADDDEDGLMRFFSLSLARYFDDIKLYVDQFINLKSTNYDYVNDTPDLFLPMLQKYFGWKVTEHFGDADPLPLLFGENILSSGSVDVSLSEIRNEFWRRVLNNLPYIYKSKGKRHSLDALFNVIGIGKENIRFKEYGYLPGGSIDDTRVLRQKDAAILGFGTASLTTSFVEASIPSSSLNNGQFTVETLMQLPFVSASYTGSLLTGSVWELQASGSGTGYSGVRFYWVRDSLTSENGKFVLTSSDGQHLTSSNVQVFDGDFYQVSAGKLGSNEAFISVRGVDSDEIDLSADVTGTTAFTVTTNEYDKIIMGASSGSNQFTLLPTQGFYGEYRLWDLSLSSSEKDDHALHFESVGLERPIQDSGSLLGHWSLAEDFLTNASGELTGVLDLSRNDQIATGSLFPTSENPYQRFLFDYNPLSPDIDLRWTENKVRIRNTTELKLSDIASDTNEVALEFNLIDSLNEDISKIFATFTTINEAIGQPVHKYRDEYADLEGLRKIYFDRLGDTLNFNRFFGLFKWFDKKISDSIKQLLPARVRFIGGEQVVESHFLERPKYKYQYPVFRTPQDIPDFDLSGTIGFSGSKMGYYESNATMGTYALTHLDASSSLNHSIPAKESAVVLEGDKSQKFISTFGVGRGNFPKEGVFPTQYSGDTNVDTFDADSGVNFRHELARKVLSNKDRDNES